MNGAAIASRVRSVVRSRWFAPTVRVVVGGAVLIAIVVHVGAGPFVHGLLSLDVQTVVAAIVLAAVATAAAAWRWHVIAGRLGVELRWSTAVRMYYQSQLLNTVLPGGVLGDVQRAVDHGRAASKLGQAARAVTVERVAGQGVQLVLAAVILTLFGAEFESALFPVIAVALGAVAIAIVAATVASRRVRDVLAREWAEVRAALGSVSALVQTVAASIVVVFSHIATFAIATAAVGTIVPPVEMLALALVVLLAASIPLNIGGWGPREGVAGWAFALAGLGASAGVSSATLFGVLAIISVIPGVLVTRIASVISRRNHRDRQTVRDSELRDLTRRISRHGGPAEAHALERS